MSKNLVDQVYKKLSNRESTIARDLKLNFSRLATESTLAADELILLTIALARATDTQWLGLAAKQEALSNNFQENIITEAEESAAIMGMLNVYYRYRHFVEEADETAKEAYGAARLRMTALASPSAGKEKFELLALAVSAINGCERCVSSHEKALMQIGVSREKLHDVARLAAVVKGISVLERPNHNDAV